MSIMPFTAHQSICSTHYTPFRLSLSVEAKYMLMVCMQIQRYSLRNFCVSCQQQKHLGQGISKTSLEKKFTFGLGFNGFFWAAFGESSIPFKISINVVKSSSLKNIDNKLEWYTAQAWTTLMLDFKWYTAAFIKA